MEVSLTVLDRPVDFVSEGLDLDIRVVEVPEPHLIAHRMAQSHRILCVAPAYLARHGAPHQLNELIQHSYPKRCARATGCSPR